MENREAKEAEVKEKDSQEEPEYLTMGISLGLCFGMAMGLILREMMGNQTMGIAMGPGIGMCLGVVVSCAVKHSKEKKGDEEK